MGITSSLHWIFLAAPSTPQEEGLHLASAMGRLMAGGNELQITNSKGLSQLIVKISLSAMEACFSQNTS